MSNTPEEIPDWVDNTPEYRFELMEWDADGDGTSIEVSREEYIALKAHLAALRGYNAPTVTEALATIMDDEGFTGYGTKNNEQQTASHLETARDFYQRFPQLVVLPSKAFHEELAAAVADPVE